MKELMRDKLGEVIKDFRTQQGKTLRDLEKDANVSLSYLSEIEHGKKEASSEVLVAVAKGLDIPLSQILIETGERLAIYEDFIEDVNLFLANR